MRIVVLALTAVLVVGCGPAGQATLGAASPPTVEAAAQRSAPAKGPAPPVGTPKLAYRYTQSLYVPANRLATLASAHQQACEVAGPATCQVIEAQLNRNGQAATASLTLRAVPAWLSSFRRRIAVDVEKAGGEVADDSVAAEDLTRQLTDTEATLRAKTMLRERLEGLLRTHTGKLEEFIQIEQQIATTQGEIDSLAGSLAEMRQRVDTSTLLVSYQSHRAAAATGPITRALANAADASSRSIAVMITLIALIWPFVLVAAVIAVAVLQYRRLRKPQPRTIPPPS